MRPGRRAGYYSGTVLGKAAVLRWIPGRERRERERRTSCGFGGARGSVRRNSGERDISDTPDGPVASSRRLTLAVMPPVVLRRHDSSTGLPRPRAHRRPAARRHCGCGLGADVRISRVGGVDPNRRPIRRPLRASAGATGHGNARPGGISYRGDNPELSGADRRTSPAGNGVGPLSACGQYPPEQTRRTSNDQGDRGSFRDHGRRRRSGIRSRRTPGQRL